MDVKNKSDQKKLVLVSFVNPTNHFNYYKKLKDEDYEFQKGLFLNTIERGVKYPVVHFGLPSYFFGWKRDEPKTIKRKVLRDNSSVEQGVYEELASVHVDLFGTALTNIRSDNRDVTWNKFYLLLGFKQLPYRAFTETTEVHWKDWSLARYFFLNMPDDFGLSGITFYKRHHPEDYSLFMYMVLVECAHILPADQLKLNDFIQRIRADKMPSYLALYNTGPSSEAHFNSAPLYSSTPCPKTHEVTFDLRENSAPLRRRSPSPVLRSPSPILRSPSPILRSSSPRNRSSSPAPASRHSASTQSRGTSPLGTPWFFMSHPQFLRRNQRNLQKSGDLDSEGRSLSSLSLSTDDRSASPTRSLTPLPYYYSYESTTTNDYY